MRIPTGWCGRLGCMTLLLAACAEVTNPPTTVTVGRVLISGNATTLQVGQSVQLTATVRSTRDSLLSDRPVTWSSRTERVAAVTATGLVTALDTGSTVIAASSGGVVGAFTLNVVPIPVASLELVPSSVTLVSGASHQLIATTRSATGAILEGRVVTWSSLESGTASVSSSGLVTGVSPGATLVTARSEGVSAVASVAVSEVSVATVSVSPSADTVDIGESTSFTAVARDAAGNVLGARAMTWTTLHPGIASVSSSGVATGLAAGTARIEVMSEGQSDTASVVVTQPPSGWTTGPSMSAARWHFAFAVVNGVAIAAGGYDFATGGHRVTVEALVLPNGTWATRPNRPSVQTSAAVSVVGNQLYAVGGTNSVTFVAETWSYEPATDVWRPRAPMPLGGRADAASATVNGIVYVAGGRDGTAAPVNRLESLDPSTDSAGTWLTRAPMPTARREAAGAELGGLFYVAGGAVAGDGVTGALEAYNPATNAWLTLAPMPTPRRDLVLVAIGGALYAVGGNNGAHLNTVEKYDPAQNTWTSAAPMPTARTGARGVVYNGKLYVLGGYTEANTGSVALEVFTP